MIIDFENILTVEELGLLERTKQTKKVIKGETIFVEGKLPSGVFFLTKGKVKVFITDSRDHIIYLAKPGDFMGHRALLGNDTYSCTAVALEDAEMWFISKEIFFAFFDHNTRFCHAIIKLLCEELRYAEHHLAGLARKPVKARVAEILLLLADTYGYREDGQTIAVSLTREELADLVGTATETTIRLLNNLKEEGLLATEGKKVRLLDRSALERYSENA
jgi:CRP-like cAMP-binding protein